MIGINNLTNSKVDEKFLKRVARKVLKGENQTSHFAPCNCQAIKKEGIDLSISLVGQTRIRKLNKKYRGKNQTTDVLSFGNGLNEIVICPREIKKNAKRLNNSFKRELTTVIIHGILHLLGYDHKKDEKESEKMEKKQEYYLNLFKC